MPPAGSLTGFAAFRYRDFSAFIFAKFFSAGTYHMMLVAVFYQIYDITGDPLNLAMVNLCMIVPVFVFALFTGWVADVFDRRNLLMVCYGVMALGALGLCIESALGLTRLWPTYLLLTIIGTARAFSGPSSNALVPNLTPRAVFPNALAWNESAGKTAQFVGPATGGFLYLIGPEVVYAMAAATFALGALATLVISSRAAPHRKSAISLSFLLEGMRYVFIKRIILGALAIDLIAALMGGVQAVLPIFAKDILEVGAQGAGILRSAMAMGGLLAALLYTLIRLQRAGTTMRIAMFCYGAAAAVFALSTSFPLSIVALAVLGMAELTDANVRQTILQMATPDQLRGRVGAVNSISSSMGTEIGGFRAGAMAAVAGAVPAVALGGAVVMLAALSIPKLFPELAAVRRLDRIKAD